MRALITGASGFAGGWLCRACVQAGDAVTGISRRGTAPAGVDAHAVDLLDGDAVASAVRDAAPEVVYHLAALTSVGRSWEDPAHTLSANIGGAATLLEALRHHAPDARVVWVSTCEVYGSPARLPTAEDAPLAPANPYAVSKAAGEQLSNVYALAHGLQIVVARPFSHSGPGQLPIFLLSNLTRQAAQGRLDGITRLRVVTGNPDTRRDFTDVRDVARAYRALGDRRHDRYVQRLLGRLGVRRRAGPTAGPPDRPGRARARRRPVARARLGGHGAARRQLPADRRHRLEARDRIRSDDGRRAGLLGG